MPLHIDSLVFFLQGLSIWSYQGQFKVKNQINYNQTHRCVLTLAIPMIVLMDLIRIDNLQRKILEVF